VKSIDVAQLQETIQLIARIVARQPANASDHSSEQPQSAGTDQPDRVHQYQEIGLLPFRGELSRHLVGEQSTVAPAAQAERTARLYRQDGPHVIRCDDLERWGEAMSIRL